MSATTIILAILLGVTAGVFAGMFGVGGGILFVPVLVALGLDQLEAQGTSLLAILPTVLAGSWSQRRYGNLRARTAIVVGLASIIGVEIGARIATELPESTLRRLFAVLLFVAAAQLARGERAEERRATLIRRDPRCRRDRSCARRLGDARCRSTSPRSATTSASAFLLRITSPGQDTVLLGDLEWPTSTTTDVQSFQYPADGSIVSVGRSRAAVFASPGAAAATQSFAEAIVVSLFNGEIVAGKVTASVSAGASARSAGAETDASEVQGLRALGRDIPSAAGNAALEDWGTLTVLSSDTGSRKAGPPGAQASVTALRIRLTAAHGGLPAGSEIVIGSAQAISVADLSAPPRPPSSPGGDRPTTSDGRPDRLPRAPEPDVGGEVAGGPVKVAPEVSARLSSGGFVFPVYGTASFGDSFGGPRPNVPGGWHHGEDIFAAAGTPLLAVADGTLHTIGFTKIGGYRLWLRDTLGNEFYYAHLSAYSPLAVEGRSVRAGDVIGFVGDTGDADGGSPHLHFEIHPSAMAGLGYDGVVAPYSILLAWRRADDISFSAGRIYVPTGPGSATLPPPGAVLLEADDIASTSGLVPGALEKALRD